MLTTFGDATHNGWKGGFILIGSRLKELRKQQKMTLKELAEGAGVSISFLSQVERGKSSVTLESLRKISEVLGVNPSVFFAGRCDCSTILMISSFSDAGYLIRRRPHLLPGR